MKSIFFTNLSKVYKNYGKEYKSALIKILIASTIGIAVSIGLPLLSAKLLIHFTNSELEQTLIVAACITVVYFIEMLKMFFIRRNNQVFRRGTVRSVQMSLGRAILNVRQEDLDSHSSGTFIQRLASDTEEMSSIFTHGAVILTRFLSAVGSFIAVLIIDWRMFIYYVIAAAILSVLNFIKHEKVGIKEIAFRKAKDKVAGLTGELVRGARDIKTLNAKESFMENLDKRISEQNERVFEARNIDSGFHLLISCIKSVFEFGAIVIMIFMIRNNLLSVAVAIAIYNYRNAVLTSFTEMVSELLEKCKLFNIATDRIFSIIESKNVQKEQFGDVELNNVRGDIAFENVTFGYDKDKMVLNGVSFDIKNGEAVGIVGKSGSGKTTIFNLLCRLYNTNSGMITLDGVDIENLTERALRGNVSVIGQAPYIFNMSINDNFRLINKDVTDEQIKDACKLACLDEHIETLPMQYDNIIGEGGVTLSGGQRQRLAIARALLQNTRVILFDEATSALDNDTQSKIQESIEKLKGSRTMIIIAHRLSTVINCDRIIILKNGTIDDIGTHEELLARNAEYQNLYTNENT
jgi:ABC-type multidrug transport system fused ATPase/permease subunit